MTRRAPGLALPFVLLAGAAAWAQEKTEPETPLPPRKKEAVPPAPPLVPPDLWVDFMMRRSWETVPARLFAATTVDIGWIYLRPRLSVGYGRPFTSWAGIDINPTFSANAIGFYGGLRLNLPRLSWRAGARYTFALYHAYLDAKASYDRLDFDLTTNPRSRALTYETELEGSWPLGPGDVVGLASLSAVRNVPDGKLVYEETLRVIVEDSTVWRFRGGYVLRFGSKLQHSAGVVVDVLDVPGRDSGLTVRAGPIVRIVLSRRVEMRGSFVVTVKSPDTLGLIGSDFTELGLRYRWATE